MADVRTIDLNADLGEGFGPWLLGDDGAMLTVVTSANLACGGHASDPDTMYRTLSLAKERGINIGAHPSFPDKEGFGRRRLPHTPAEIERFVAAQIGALGGIAALAGARVSYVKPHGALGNAATEDRPIAEAILRATRAVDRSLAILAISGTILEAVAREQGLLVFSEVFADRGYTAAGNLVPRGQPGALIHDAEAASLRMLRFIESGIMPTADGREVPLAADSICIHGDSADAIHMAQRLRSAIEERGIRLAAFLSRP